ncbi:MAG: iron-containing alcohol dehydrogenase [Oscillospiraceae bacterium]|nr:iron-containing alcohol dehydrogenase [Oscillospiraceae bacterium]
MRALILNSGTGSRMKSLKSCKCLAELSDGVTIFDAQIKSLLRCGIDEFVITTGSNAEVLEAYAKEKYPNTRFIFVFNPLYAETNYIYSIKLAIEHLRGDDILMLHGDIVYEQNVLQDIIASEKSVMVTDRAKALPEKDFKAVVRDNRISYVGVDVLTDAVYAQPMYKLCCKDWELWLDEIETFCLQGKTNVYAENAFNEISGRMLLHPFDITGRMCFEVDNDEDLSYARDMYKLMPDRLQETYAGYGSRLNIHDILAYNNVKRPFIVCGIGKASAADITGVYFDKFTPNPDISEIMDGISLFEAQDCDFIVSIGGGSAIDVAKCINMLRADKSLRDTPRCKHLAIPTTAGTGSEATSFAVMYENGVKISVEQSRVMPDCAILDPDFLLTVPIYHKKSAFLDMLCQAIESMWSVNQTEISRAFAAGAIEIAKKDMDGYFAGELGSLLRIFNAANLAGKAINISKTTAAHAMSYELTARYGLAHGHAVAVCLKHVWKFLIESGFKPAALIPIGYNEFINIYDRLEMEFDFGDESVQSLVSSVNVERLSNFPVKLSETALADMYRQILNGE